ncbi:MAG: hypothetical protein GWP91_12820 [Rhodobacterales bacterium]|nr:hypothetical protein [Rhodobacterales bacterium]
MRRLVTFVVITIGTAIASLHWLHNGDLMEAVVPVIAEWDADLLARNAGLEDPPAEPKDTDEE